MFLRTNDLFEATSFVTGMDVMQEKPMGREFWKWIVSEEPEVRSPFCWSIVVEHYMDKRNIAPEDRVSKFLDMLLEFLEQDNADKHS